MTNECPSCGAEQSQAWLCHDCCAAIQTMLDAAPQLVDQLNIAIAQQAKVGGSGKAGKGSAHTKSPINWGVVAVRDALMVELALWGDDINEIRRHPKAREIASGIGHVVKNAYRAIDRAQDRQYLGRCLFMTPDGECQAELWVRPGAKTIRCRVCEYEHNVANRRLDMLEMAEDMIVTVREASEYIGKVGEIIVTQDRIRGYIRRSRIAYRAPVEARRFRLGDLLTVILDDSEKQTA